SPQPPQLVAGLLEGVRIAANEHEVGAGLGKCLCDRPPQSATAARDQRPPSRQAKPVQHVHRYLPRDSSPLPRFGGEGSGARAGPGQRRAPSRPTPLPRFGGEGSKTSSVI